MKALVPVILMASVIDADQIPVKMIFKSKPRSVFMSEQKWTVQMNEGGREQTVLNPTGPPFVWASL